MRLASQQKHEEDLKKMEEEKNNFAKQAVEKYKKGQRNRDKEHEAKVAEQQMKLKKESERWERENKKLLQEKNQKIL